MAAISWNPSSFCFPIFSSSIFPLEFLGLAWELHGEILWEGRMIGRKLDLVWTFMVCIDDSAWFLKACLSSSRFFFLVIFGAFSWWFSWRDFEAVLLGICWGVYAWTIRGSFPFDSPPKSVRKGAQFWVFVVLGFGVFLAEILRFLLIQRVLVDHNLAMECPWGVPTVPKVLFGSVERIGSWIWRSWPAGVVQPELPRLDRSDRC
jgi:hypothetical protein